MQTLKKLPQIAPNKAAAPRPSGDASSAALSSSRNAKVSGGLKRILHQPLRLAAAAHRWLADRRPGCNAGPTPRRASDGLAGRGAAPRYFAEAVRRIGGAHYHGTARFAARRGGPDAVTTTTDVWVDRAGNYRIAR